MIFGFLVTQQGQEQTVAILAFSLLAGLSELFFPSLLKQFDQGLDWKKSAGSPPDGGKPQS
ncbi:MAG: hypothetical protein JNK37_09580 [Verrucomicrobiales bacterium]|nr:hypothetical protein [Verrucomicrobiales bacterium]